MTSIKPIAIGTALSSFFLLLRVPTANVRAGELHDATDLLKPTELTVEVPAAISRNSAAVMNSHVAIYVERLAKSGQPISEQTMPARDSAALAISLSTVKQIGRFQSQKICRGFARNCVFGLFFCTCSHPVSCYNSLINNSKHVKVSF
jgi:tetrahydromethanopterin S-methyltransferase subunit C